MKSEHPWARAGLQIRGRADRSGQYLLPIPLPRPKQPYRRKRSPPTWDHLNSFYIGQITVHIRAAGGRLAYSSELLRRLAHELSCPQCVILTYIQYNQIHYCDGHLMVNLRYLPDPASDRFFDEFTEEDLEQ